MWVVNLSIIIASLGIRLLPAWVVHHSVFCYNKGEMDDPKPQDTPAMIPAHSASDDEQNKDIAAFSYLWIMSVIVYFLKKDASPFIRFHSKQAMVLFVLSIIFAFVPYLSRGLEIIVLVGCVYGFMAAAQGLWKDVPLVGPFSRGEMSLREVWREIVNLAMRIANAAKDVSKTAVKKAAPPSEAQKEKKEQQPPSPPALPLA